MKNTQKLLIHKLRKDRIQLSNYNKKKLKLLLAQGGALFSKKKNSQNSQHTSLDDATFDAETESHIHGTKETAFNAGKLAGIAAVGFQVAEATVTVATPLLAMSGIGVPLAAALFVLSEFSKMARINAELMVFAKDSEFILSQFVKLHRMMIRVIIEYFNAFDSDVDIDNKISNKSSPDDDDDDNEEKNPSKIKELQKFSIDTTIIKNIEAKLNEFGVTLKSLNLDKKFSIKRFTYSASTLSKLTKIITVLNAYFIIYNAKFEHLIRHYNYVIGQENAAKSLEIWDSIHASDEYKTYMGQMNQNPKEYLNKIKTAVVNDPNAKKQVNKADNKNKSNAQKLIKNVKNEEVENKPQDTPEDTPQDTPEDKPQDTPQDTPEDKPQDTPEDKPQDKPQFKPQGIPPQEELDKMKVEDILGGGSPVNSKGQNIAQFILDTTNDEKQLILGLDEYFGHYNSFDPETGNTAVLALIQRTKETGEILFIDFLQYFFDKNQATKAVPNKNGDLPITEAIYNNFFGYAELILRSPTHQYNSHRQTFVPLSDVSNGRGNINLNQQDSKGYTALTAIVEKISQISNYLPLSDSNNMYDRAVTIKELIFDDYLLFMSNISLSTNEGKTPLMIAAINDDISMIKDLFQLENNINNKIDFENQQPNTGLFSSIQYPYTSLDINAQDKDGNTALMYAIKNYMPFDSDDDNMSTDDRDQLATFLLQDNSQTQNINVNLQNKDNDSALHIAVKLRYLDIIIQLLEKNANPFIENNQFHTPMFIAMAGLNSIEIDTEKPTHSTVIDYDKKEDYEAILNIMLSYGIDFKKITSFKSSIMTNCTNYDSENQEVIDSFSQEKIHPNNIVLVPTENPIQQITHPFMSSQPQNEKGPCYDKENFWVWIVTQLSNGSKVTDPLTRKPIHPDWIKRTYTSKNFKDFITEAFRGVNMQSYINDPRYRMPQVNLERFHHLVRFYLGND